MPIDATTRHVFAYGGTALQMADEHTMVYVSGNTLQFTSTVTQSQHFLARAKPRKLVAFDVNGRANEIAVTSRDPNPEVLIYSYPDKKLRGKLQNGAAMEYSHLRYSRCGRRLITLRPEEAATNPTTSDTKRSQHRLCIWDMEKYEPLKGCGAAVVTMDVAFVSFDPSNSDHVLLGGPGGLQLWKIYKGKASYMLRNVIVKVRSWGSMGRQRHVSSHLVSDLALDKANDPAAAQDLEERRTAWVGHTWMRNGRVLVTNRAGELVLLDTNATTSGSELTGTIIESATRPGRCWIVGVVYTTETILLAYADGHVAWLDEKDFELLQTAVLPSCDLGVTSGEANASATNGAHQTGGDGSQYFDGNGTVVVASVAPSPNYSKVYVGTHDGHIYELKVSCAADEDEELDDGELGLAGPPRGEDPSLAATRLITCCGSFPTGAVLATTTLTPCGGSFPGDLVVASGGRNGRLYLWNVSKCRLIAETSVRRLFTAGAVVSNGEAAGGGGSVGPPSSSASSSSSSLPPTALTAAAAAATAQGNAVVPTGVPGVEVEVPDGACCITALAGRPADPVLLLGDSKGQLRVLCVSKVVGGNGALEFLPLHAMQLFEQDRTLDLLELHPTQPFALAASTVDRHAFMLSLDHESRFRVVAYLTLPSDGGAGERILDAKWSVPPHSPTALSLTILTTTGRLYSARHQAEPSETTATSAAANGASGPPPVRLRPKIVAHGDELVAKCASLQFLPEAPIHVFLGTSPQFNDLLVLKYADVVLDPTSRVALEPKVLAQDAHDGGITAIAVYGQRLRAGEELVATAGRHGGITLWTITISGGSNSSSSNGNGKTAHADVHLEDVVAVKKKSLVPHLGAVLSMAFVDLGPEDLYLVTTGADGCVDLIDVRISSDLLGAPAPEPRMSPLYINVANFAKYEDPFKPEPQDVTPAGANGPRPFLELLQDELELAARNRFDRLKDKTRAQLNDLELRLKLLLAENDKLPEAERLDRDEFVINTAWRDRLVQRHHERAEGVREGIVRDLAKMNIVRERMKREFWDVASVHGVKLRGLASPAALFVYNFPMRQQSKADALRVKKIELLRLVEHEHLKQQLLEANPPGATTPSSPIRPVGAKAVTTTTTVPSVASGETALARFQDCIGANLQWLMGAGIHHPSLNRWVGDKAKAAAGAPLTGSALQLPAPPAGGALNALRGFHLVYHPAAIRTRRQQRLQIQLLHDFIRALLVEFNREFEELIRLKETRIEEIETKNARILEIGRELGHGEAPPGGGLFRPTWAADERAESILEIRPEEMTQVPYESEAARRQREREREERLALERQRQQDDVAGRALRDMMDGTLEVKKEPLASQTLVKEPWMLETPVEEMTAEQKKLLAQFEAAQQRLKEEQDKYRKSLDLELKKIRTEIQDLCRAFDDRLRQLHELSLAVRTSVLAQQLYALRLAEELLEYEHLVAERQRLEGAMAARQSELRLANKEGELFAQQLEACKDEWHRAVEEDRLLDKGFLRDLEEALAPYGVVVEHEIVKHLIELFRKRKPEDLRGGGVGGGAGGGAGAGGSNANGPRRGKSHLQLQSTGDSKNRLLNEATSAASSDASGSASAALSSTASRTLAAATLLQGLQGGGGGSGLGHGEGIEGEDNFDPFAGLEPMPSLSSTANTAPHARHVAPLDYEVDRPDGLLLDDRLWRALNELRARKILAEQSVRDKAEQLAHARAVADELRVKSQELAAAHDELTRALAATQQELVAFSENTPLLVHIKQGQDEATSSGEDIFRAAAAAATTGTTGRARQGGGHGESAASASAALLVARTSVEALNDIIQLHGKDQVHILGKIKNFRKNINVMEWEHTLLEMQTRDMEERYTDIQLLRVTKELQELFHTGDTSEKQKRELALLEAKLEHLGRNHQANLLKLDKSHAQLSRQLRERQRENQHFADQAQQLEMQVQIREDILASRKTAALRHAASTADDDSGGGRMKAITVRRKLVDLARAQTEEIEYLRMELDKMRRRTFPSFAQHQAAREYQSGDSRY